MLENDLGGGFKYFLFSPLFGEDSHFDSYFSKGLVQPPTSDGHHLKQHLLGRRTFQCSSWSVFGAAAIAVPPPSLVQSQGGGGSLIRWAASQQGGSGAVAVVEGTLGTWVGWWTPLGKGPWCFCFLFSSLNRKQHIILLIGCLKFFGCLFFCCFYLCF